MAPIMNDCGFIMNRVQLLSDDVIKKIAAGEVVERPASVVKELVENSLDAGAKRIVIELEEGGKKRITVEDDGCGIPPEDCLLALCRHATSKITKDEDLFAISTLGFRGEALAAISAIADFSLSTRVRGTESGCKLTIEAGSVPDLVPWAGNVGTVITVAKLFCTVPVRAKFLKGAETEFAHCHDLIQALALAYPFVSFSLYHNGKLRFSAHALDIPLSAPWRGEAILRERWNLVVGKDEASRAIYVREENEFGRWEALLSAPGYDKATNKNVVHFVNGRWVKDKVLNFGILRGYHSHLLKGRHPQVLSFFECDASLIDVNVHPAKTELRFQYPAEVQGLMSFAIRKNIREATWSSSSGDSSVFSDRTQNSVLGTSAPEVKGSPAPHASNSEVNLDSSNSGVHCGSSLTSLPFPKNNFVSNHQTHYPVQDHVISKQSFADGNAGARNCDENAKQSFADCEELGFAIRSEQDAQPDKRAPYPRAQSQLELARLTSNSTNSNGSEVKEDPQSMLKSKFAGSNDELLACGAGDYLASGADIAVDRIRSQTCKSELLENLNYIGTYAKCYMLFEQNSKLLAIDQHAFHERILYERLCANPKLLAQSQPLMMPEAIQLAAFHIEALQKNIQTVNAAGFSLKFLPGSTVEICAVPTLLIHKRYDDFFIQFAEKLAEGSISSAQHIHHDLLSTIACHAAIRSGEELCETEMRVLLAEAENVDFYHNCPHGRRVFKTFEKNQVAKWFDR